MVPNKKQKLAGRTIVGAAGLVAGAFLTGGKLEDAIASAVVSLVIHEMFSAPVTNYVTTHPQEFPRFLTQ